MAESERPWRTTTDPHIAAGAEVDEEDMMGETAEGGDRGGGDKTRAVAEGAIIRAAGVPEEAAGGETANTDQTTEETVPPVNPNDTIDRVLRRPGHPLRI